MCDLLACPAFGVRQRLRVVSILLLAHRGRQYPLHDDPAERVADENDGPLNSVFELFGRHEQGRPSWTWGAQPNLAVSDELRNQRLRVLQDAI